MLLKFIYLFCLGLLPAGVYSIDISSSAVSQNKRDLRFLNPRAPEQEISIGEKKYKKLKDKYFVDGWGREAFFRGWNYANRSKRPEVYWLPHKTLKQGQETLRDLRAKTGSNIIRYLFLWDGAHPEVDVINYTYLRKVVEAIRMAIEEGFYVLFDFHQDLFSRYITKHPLGDGAPKWVIEGMNLPSGKCSVFGMCLSWAQNYFTNRATKAALRNFWNNAPVETKNGRRRAQDEFYWMMQRSLSYIHGHLYNDEFQKIIGLDPYNEPPEGGLKEYDPPLNPKEWHDQKLGPFYERYKSYLTNTGWSKKLFFAEPSTFWNVSLPIVTPRGWGLMPKLSGSNNVFNAHFYDELRESVGFQRVLNGAYLVDLDYFRIEARRLDWPPFISEYGFVPSHHHRVMSFNRVFKAMNQGMETSMTQNKLTKNLDFYAPVISSTAWTWEVDGSNYSPAGNNNKGYDKGVDPLVVERGFPRRVQGPLMTFYYNDNARDGYDDKPLDWVKIRVRLRGQRRELFLDKKFLWVVWRGRASEMPTELFIPGHFNKETSIVLTDKKVLSLKGTKESLPDGSKNEIFYFTDVEDHDSSGIRLFIYDDKDPTERKEDYHYALVVDLEDEEWTSSDLRDLQQALYKKVQSEQSPLFLDGKVRPFKPKKSWADKWREDKEE